MHVGEGGNPKLEENVLNHIGIILRQWLTLSHIWDIITQWVPPEMMKRQTRTKSAVCAQKLGVIVGSVTAPGSTEMTHAHQIRDLRTKLRGLAACAHK